MQKYEYVTFPVNITMFSMSIGKENFEDVANKMGKKGWKLHSLVPFTDTEALAIFERPTGTKEEDV